MTTYNEIAGRRVNFLSSDPTYVDTNSDGQVWYNSIYGYIKVMAYLQERGVVVET
jgi:hypothetical protein